MSEIEREEFISRIKAMSEEEMKLACKMMPSEILVNEIGLRLVILEKRAGEAKELLGKVV